MTPEQQKQSNALIKCTFLRGSKDKRFAKDMRYYLDKDLTPKQAEYLNSLIYKYRRQIPNYEKLLIE